MSNPNSIHAAQYLRMSTEHEQYSMANQAAAVGQYAEAHGFEIIQTYDEGRSGLVVRHRSGLQSRQAYCLTPQILLVEPELVTIRPPSRVEAS